MHNKCLSLKGFRIRIMGYDIVLLGRVTLSNSNMKWLEANLSNRPVVEDLPHPCVVWMRSVLSSTEICEGVELLKLCNT